MGWVLLRVLPAEVDEDGHTWCRYEIVRDGIVHSGRGPGVDSMQALISALMVLAIEVRDLRKNGEINWYDSPFGYCCLDEIRLDRPNPWADRPPSSGPTA
jgi:hypothetical protein